MPDESVIEGSSLMSSKISRRKLMKAGAIVGGVAWAAPVIDSFASPASAGSSTAGCYVCFSGPNLTGAAFFAGQDNPGPAEAISSCTAEGALVPAGDGGPYTSGSYVLFNTSDPAGSFGSYSPTGFTGAFCIYGTTGHAPAELNDSCPATWTAGGTPTAVSCQTGAW